MPGSQIRATSTSKTSAQYPSTRASASAFMQACSPGQLQLVAAPRLRELLPVGVVPAHADQRRHVQVRLLQLERELPAQLAEQAVRLDVVAAEAGDDDVVPRVCAAAGT